VAAIGRPWEPARAYICTLYPVEVPSADRTGKASTTLYRAAAAESPHTGFRSYWVHAESDARCFLGWLENESPFPGPHQLYRAVVDLSSLRNVPLPTTLESWKVTAIAADLAAKGWTWFSFYERPYRGWMPREYIYLGQEPIPAQPC
jgi:hypothetical protein